MRIIAGKYRRRQLVSPPETVETRPIPDRVKESVFSILRGNIEGARVVDVFAGTGAVGLEAVSRGASECVFVERDKRAAGVLERNIETLGCGDQCSIVRADALGPAVLTRLSAMGGADLIFFDPPYPLVLDGAPGGGWERVKRQLERCIAMLSETGFAVLRTPWPFRHLDDPAEEAGASGEDGAARGERGDERGGERRRGKDADRRRAKGRDELEDVALERHWIGSEIDVEAIERETRELQRRLEERDAAGGARDRGRRGSSLPPEKRKLGIKDLAGLEDEGEGEAGEALGEGEELLELTGEGAQGEEHKPGMHMVDLRMEGAVGPETHKYGSTAVHLYMRAKGK